MIARSSKFRRSLAHRIPLSRPLSLPLHTDFKKTVLLLAHDLLAERQARAGESFRREIGTKPRRGKKRTFFLLSLAFARRSIERERGAPSTSTSSSSLFCFLSASPPPPTPTTTRSSTPSTLSTPAPPPSASAPSTVSSSRPRKRRVPLSSTDPQSPSCRPSLPTRVWLMPAWARTRACW